MKLVIALACLSVAFALKESPAEPTESKFFAPMFAQSIPQLAAQEAISRKYADVILGMQVTHNFQMMGYVDMMKFHTESPDDAIDADSDSESPLDSDSDSDDERLGPVMKGRGIIDRPVLINGGGAIGGGVGIINNNVIINDDSSPDDDSSPEDISSPESEESSPDGLEDPEGSSPELDDDDEDDISLLQTGEFFHPYGAGAYGGFGYPYGGFGAKAEKPSTPSRASLENTGSYLKMSALKAMHLQFYMAAADVERSYWNSKLMAAALPPQMSIFKLYKTYLNTMAMSVAYQFHDAFTQEAYLDDFNDRYGDKTGSSSQLSEVLSEQNVYSKWYTLSTLKFQLFMLSMYEQMTLQHAMQATAGIPGAASLLQEGVETHPFFGAAGAQDPASYLMYQKAYLNYYTMMLKYYGLFQEMTVSHYGMLNAHFKHAMIAGAEDPDGKKAQFGKHLEEGLVPMAYQQWASVGHMRYSIELYSLMLDMYMPQFAAAQESQRAEDTFQNLVQTDAPELTPEQQ